jgi:hypothetical protein
MARIHSKYLLSLSVVGIGLYIWAYYQYGYTNSKFGADLAALVFLAFMSASTTYPAVKALKNMVRTDTDQFVVSYWSVWLVFLAQRLWVIYLGVLNTPESSLAYQMARESPISGLIGIMIAISAAHGAAAPYSGTVKYHKRDLIIFLVAGAFSGIIAGTAAAVFVNSGWN